MSQLDMFLDKVPPFKVDGKELMLYPLGTDAFEHVLALFDIFEAGKKAENKSEEERSMVMINALREPKTMESVKYLIKETLDLSLPDEDERKREQFGMKYFMALIMHIAELNLPSSEGMDEKKQEKLKSRLEEMRAKRGGPAHAKEESTASVSESEKETSQA